MIEVIHGDCLEEMKKMEDNSVDLIITDPPYGMNYVSSWRKHKHDRIDDDDNLEWIEGVLKEYYRILKENTHCYIFCNDYAISIIREKAKEIGFTPKRTLVWIKNNHTSGDLEGDYSNITEFILFFHKGRRNLKGKRERNVLYFNRENCDEHPTRKPKELIKYLIEKSSNKGDLVVDSYGGSGTTAEGCKEIGRKCKIIEKEKKYIDIINKHLKTTTESLFI